MNFVVRVKEEVTRRMVDRAVVKSSLSMMVLLCVEDDLRRYKELGEMRKEFVEVCVWVRVLV